MMEVAMADDEQEQEPQDKPDKKRKLPVVLRGDKTKQFTDSGGAEKKG